MSKTTLAYISGPMTGLPEYNYPAFTAASQELRKKGYAVLNPASNFEGDTTFDHTVYMRHDMSHVLQADKVYVLPGWRNSKGARAEVHVAQLIGIPVLEYETNMPVRITVTTDTVPWQD
jgi:hypothetical protein